jgi:hypothetical protein
MIATEQTKAIELHAKLATINPLDVPVMSRERMIPRKEQAALARQLFKSMGLRGISVTTPNYSMASTVRVRLPKRDDYELNEWGTVKEGDPVMRANSEAGRRVESILLAAFPRHDDRSDTMSDYFDYCWSVD